jgi:hypothetical protein
MSRKALVLSGVVLLSIAALAVWSGQVPREREVLREVYSPTFGTVPQEASIATTIDELRKELGSAANQGFLERLVPDQAGVLWITVLVALAVGFDFSRGRSSRNLDLILALALGLVLFDVMRFFSIRLDPVHWRLLDAVYTVVVALNLALLVRALWRAAGAGAETPWRPNLRGRPLAAVAVLLAALNVAAALVRAPDDAGYFINLGAQRLRERGRLPYGDPLLTNTPGAAYGPVLYAAHVPFQFLIEPHSPNPVSGPNPLKEGATYFLPPLLATKLCTITFHLAGLLALFVVGRRLTSEPDVGWALVALYCGSAFVMGIGGGKESIGGMTFISHIAPAASTLVAFACLPWPAASGAMLAVSAGVGFYPAFMLPAWFAFFWRNRVHAIRFGVGFAVAATIICGSTWLLSRPADGRGRIGTILHDTFGHHTDPQGYGRSPYGFWGQREGIRGWMTTPLVGESGFSSPSYLLFFGLIGATVWLARNASASRLALLTGAIGLASSLVKIQPTGTYVSWAYPFLLIGIFAGFSSARGRSAGDGEVTARELPRAGINREGRAGAAARGR